MKLLKKFLISTFAVMGMVAASSGVQAQFNLGRAVNALKSTAQAITLSDAQIASYVHQYILQQDSVNKVSPDTSQYSRRLKILTSGLNSVEGIPLNFKVYETKDVNAFACADGSVRVYSGLMDIMTDDEVLGVIGHEMGHVALHHTKNAFKQALLRSALRDGLASTSTKVAAFTDSQLSELGEALAGAKYSRKQENQADDYGYKFLKDNGKNPGAMVLSFQKLQQLEGAQGGSMGSAVNQLFSSHPDISKRIKRMQEQCKKDDIDMATLQSNAKTQKDYVVNPANVKKSTKSSSTKKTTKKTTNKSTKKTTTQKSTKKK